MNGMLGGKSCRKRLAAVGHCPKAKSGRDRSITGRGGLSLYDHWTGGFRTFHGMMSHGFPNQFFTGFTQAGVSANTTAMFEPQGSHIAYIIKETAAITAQHQRLCLKLIDDVRRICEQGFGL